MYSWFEKHAPIRSKFDAMTVMHTGLAVLVASAAFTAGQIGTFTNLWSFVTFGLIGLTTIAVLVTKKAICDPYVNTVVRMEGLADGDTTSEIEYQNHRDCVGRMTAAMLTFRDNANKVQAASAVQEQTVDALTVALGQLASSDLTARLSNELPQEYAQLRIDFNSAAKSLRDTLAVVVESTASINHGANEIRQASDDLSHRTERQAAQLEETLAEMNTLTAEVQKTAQDADGVNKSMAKAKSQAEHSGDVMTRAVQAMSDIEKASSEISNIINIIDEIAFQTNLLALNAGVEAARAGESGKGFAVVASEVRALAQRSAEAANDVKSKIMTSQQQVEAGVNLVGETGKALEGIVGSIGEVTGLVAEISESTQRQAGGLQTINSSVTDMGSMTQQNAAMAEEANAATRSLSEKADELRGRLSGFVLDGDGVQDEVVAFETMAA